LWENQQRADSMPQRTFDTMTIRSPNAALYRRADRSPLLAQMRIRPQGRGHIWSCPPSVDSGLSRMNTHVHFERASTGWEGVKWVQWSTPEWRTRLCWWATAEMLGRTWRALDRRLCTGGRRMHSSWAATASCQALTSCIRVECPWSCHVAGGGNNRDTKQVARDDAQHTMLRFGGKHYGKC
jgi:hypothetical protein